MSALCARERGDARSHARDPRPASTPATRVHARDLAPCQALSSWPLAVLGPGHEKGHFGMQSPGPAASYKTVSSMGSQVHSKTRSAPSSVFSRASRWARYEKELKANTTPGPGAY